MNKIERLKKQYLEWAEVVNAFQSEAVQLAIVERLGPLLYTTHTEQSSSETETTAETTLAEPGINETIKPVKDKKFGATKAMHFLLTTDYFDTPKAIREVVMYCNNMFKTNIPTTDFSGALLKFVSLGKLKRMQGDSSSRYVYLK